MAEARASIDVLPPAALIAVEVWAEAQDAGERLAAALGGALPGPLRSADLAGGWRAMRVEPSVWWLAGPRSGAEALASALEAALAADGAQIDLSGALTALEVAGAGWRELLMIGGVFDAEDPAFGPGATAATILHHAGVRYDVIDDDRVRIFVAPSYAQDLLERLRAAAARPAWAPRAEA